MKFSRGQLSVKYYLHLTIKYLRLIFMARIINFIKFSLFYIFSIARQINTQLATQGSNRIPTRLILLMDWFGLDFTRPKPKLVLNIRTQIQIYVFFEIRPRVEQTWI